MIFRRLGLALAAVLVATSAAACGDTAGSGAAATTASTSTTSDGVDTTTTSIPPTTTSTSTTTSTTTTTTTIPPIDEAHVIANGLCVLGWWDGASWVLSYEQPDTPPPAPAGTAYQVATPTTTYQAEGGAPLAASDDYEPTWYVELDPVLPFGTGVAISGAFDVVPRSVRETSTDQAAYREAAAALMAARGYPDVPVEVTQVIRTDIEGDGEDEVIVTARHPGAPEFLGEPGVFSLVFMRKVIDGTVETAILHDSIFTEDDIGLATSVDVAAVSAVADLNGDGKMEIVLDGGYYEGAWSEAYEYVDDDLGPIVVLACGVGV